MKRLLTCGHKDAYSILGLRSDVSDEEIKRFYRRQAVLVHPDKVSSRLKTFWQQRQYLLCASVYLICLYAMKGNPMLKLMML